MTAVPWGVATAGVSEWRAKKLAEKAAARERAAKQPWSQAQPMPGARTGAASGEPDWKVPVPLLVGNSLSAEYLLRAWP